jgi:hypothetical protein
VEALIGAVVGGLLTALGAYGISTIQDRRAESRSAREQRLAAAREVLAALQELNRRMVDVARIDSSDYDDRPWPELHAGTIRWNVARLSAALVAPQNEIKVLHEIDAELDRVMDQALTKHWQSRAFRAERHRLGALGATYLNLVRVNEGLHKTEISSIWPWAAHE